MVRSTVRAWAAQAARTVRAAAVVCGLVWLSALLSGQSPAADAIDPVVRIISPAEDATVSGTVTIVAEATDEGGIAGVTFEVDGRMIGTEVVTAPWRIAWSTSASGSGSHILTAIARDAAGNAVRSAVVPVVVGETAPPPFPPPPNHNPTAVGDALTSAGRIPVTFSGATLLANDTDPDGHSLIITLVGPSSTAGGTITTTTGGAYTYSPPSGFTGVDRFTYSIADGMGGTATATVTVSVTPAAPPPAPGLVLALTFDETSGGTAVDASGGGRDGTIRGAVRVAGRSGGALQFDGVDDWVTVLDAAALDLSSAMTLEAWVNPARAMTGWQTILLKEQGTGDMAYGLYANDGAPAAAGYVNVGGIHTPVSGTAGLPAASWTHLAATYDGATLRLYVNGTLSSSRARTGLIVPSGGALRIGGNNAWPDEFFEGLIDEVRIYNRALSATEVLADMAGNATQPPPPPPANNPPVARGDSLTTAAGTPVAFTATVLLGNDTDADGHALVVSSVAAATAAGGVVSSTGAGNWNYTPRAGYAGPDSFTYTITDGHGGAATGTVDVTVVAAAPPPSGTEGLVLALGFDEASGATALDASGGGRHGTIREAVRVAGKSGGALRFDGVNDWVTVPDTTASTLDLTTGMTIEAWVNPAALSGWETVVLKERGAGLLSYGLYAHDGGIEAGGEEVPAGYVRAGAADRAVRGTVALPQDTWTHLAVTYDGDTQRIYVNGVEAGSRAQTGPIAVGNGALRIGGNNAFTNEFFSGVIDEVRIYNRALTAAEIRADMQR